MTESEINTIIDSSRFYEWEGYQAFTDYVDENYDFVGSNADAVEDGADDTTDDANND